jgi:MFS family permease
MLPTFILAGLGFALTYGPLNIAATNGIQPEEQGLAGGLLNTSFQFGGALFLAIATAVNNAYAGSNGTPQATLDGYHAAWTVSVIAALIGAGVSGIGLIRRGSPATAPVAPFEVGEEEIAAGSPVRPALAYARVNDDPGFGESNIDSLTFDADTELDERVG